MDWLRIAHRHHCHEGCHEWTGWWINSATKEATCHCRFCPAVWHEQMA